MGAKKTGAWPRLGGRVCVYIDRGSERRIQIIFLCNFVLRRGNETTEDNQGEETDTVARLWKLWNRACMQFYMLNKQTQQT